MTKLRNNWVLAALFGALLSGQARASDEDVEALARERAREWEKAAVNRELAALPRTVDAGRLRGVASTLRVRQTEDRSETSRNIAVAADLTMQAAAMEQRAGSSFEAAAGDWLRSASEHGKAGEVTKRDSARSSAKDDMASAMAAYERAAECYEIAAADYAGEEVNDGSKSAAASDRAAALRERLAAMK